MELKCLTSPNVRAARRNVRLSADHEALRLFFLDAHVHASDLVSAGRESSSSTYQRRESPHETLVSGGFSRTSLCCLQRKSCNHDNRDFLSGCYRSRCFGEEQMPRIQNPTILALALKPASRRKIDCHPRTLAQYLLDRRTMCRTRSPPGASALAASEDPHRACQAQPVHQVLEKRR